LISRKIRYNLVMNYSVLINHNTLIAKMLFNILENKTCSIFDGTYRLIQKSRTFQNKSNCGVNRKKMPLVKPIVGWSGDIWLIEYFLFLGHLIKSQWCDYIRKLFQHMKMNTIHEDDVILVEVWVWSKFSR